MMRALLSTMLVLQAGTLGVTGASATVSSTEQPGAVEIVGEGVISTSDSQTFPSEDPKTGDLWFSVIGESFDAQTIMVARRDGPGWARPVTAPFAGKWGDRAPRFSPDGSELFLTSNRPRPDSNEPGDMNIWRVRRTRDGWSEPEMLDSAVNSPASDIHASVTASAIWVASNRDGSLERFDLFRIGPSGDVSHPGPPLNSELSQPDLWVSPDETWMILAITDHPDGYGGDDLYISRFENGAWNEPVNLGPEINSKKYDYGPWVTADGKYLLFTSHRDGPSHVYRAPMALVRAAMTSAGDRPAEDAGTGDLAKLKNHDLPVVLNFKDTAVSRILRAVAAAGSITLTFDDSFQDVRVTVSRSETTIEKALGLVAEKAGLRYSVPDPGELVVESAELE